jgi:DNA-binding transcriptional MerR regulator
MARDFDLKELCDRAGVTPRTVYYYVQQGLLPSPGSTGPGTRYTEAHLHRLRLIRLLQNEHLPLAEINRRLRGLSGDDVRNLVEKRRKEPAPARGSALQYVRGILNQAAPDPAREPPLLAALKSPPARERGDAGPGRSQWDRVQLGEGLELHVRRPLTRQQQRKLEKLLAAAREILEDPRE